MKSNVKKLKDCRTLLTVEVEPELVERRFQEVFREIQKSARIAGFREGKAPLDLIEQRYAQEAREEVLKSLVPEAYHRSIATQKISPVTLPSISDIKMERGKNLTFSAEFERSPEFSFKSYKGIKLKKVPMDVPHDEVEKGVASLLDSRADLVPLDVERPVEKGDFILADIEAWEGGQYKPSKKGVLLFVEPTEATDFYDKILGAQADEVREIGIEFSEEEKKQGLVGKKPQFKVWVRGIRQKKLPELNEEFAKLFGKATVEELKEAVRKDLAAYKRSESMGQMKEELYGKLLQMASFTPPQELVVRQKERLIDQTKKHFQRMGQPPAKLDEEMARIEQEAARKAEDQVRLYFILRKVAEAESIEADEMEVERRLATMAEESKRPLEEVRQVFEEDLRESLVETKTVDFLLANAKYEER